jgi:hypothetical protein
MLDFIKFLCVNKNVTYGGMIVEMILPVLKTGRLILTGPQVRFIMSLIGP